MVMEFLRQVYRRIIRFFVDEDFNRRMDTLEGACYDWSLDLRERGFRFNSEKDWYERTWSVKTRRGKETSLEVYKKVGDDWKSMMFGDDGELFFEYTVGTRTDGFTTI